MRRNGERPSHATAGAGGEIVPPLSYIRSRRLVGRSYSATHPLLILILRVPVPGTQKKDLSFEY